MARVIAFSGWRNSGKDTCADYLVREYGYTKLSLASPLKDVVAQQYNIPREYMDMRDRKEEALTQYPAIPTDGFSEQIQAMLRPELRSGFWTPRALCILEGSTKRSVYSNYWTSKLVAQMQPGEKYCISDLRYRSEADTLKLLLPKEDLLLIRINRFESIDTEDPSERDLDNYNFDSYIGSNVQDIPTLQQALRFIMLSQARN